ncbi:MAG: glycoside hydrolase family 32 protein [Mogibacterium sp.]|nr:glycoside hydrolase family 32 protein [Mogibacterium sp.]
MKCSQTLAKAREYEVREGALVPAEERPVYHFSPWVGWLNDPNGFTYYNGQYHLFYQYNPYSTYWDSMHWGHAVSDDLVRWTYLPCALAPDEPYDDAGCFSGSAVPLPDGRLLLIYTGCQSENLDPDGKWPQMQCLAVGDGIDFVKYEGNPVLREQDLPPAGDIYEFRDPYIWTCQDGTFRTLAANASLEGSRATQLTMYRSDDGFHWERDKVLFEDVLKIGVMWECPSFFPLDGSQVLMASPMNMEEEEANGSIRFPKGNNVCYMIGSYHDEEGVFRLHRSETGDAAYDPVDCGLDFYAPQVRNMPDGRCIMIGWMQDPQTSNLHDDVGKIFGQYTIPRELSLRDGRLMQKPVRELEAYRKDRVSYRNVAVGADEVVLPGISGRAVDLELSLQAKDCKVFRLRFAKNDQYYSELRWEPARALLTVDRSRSGQSESYIKERTIEIANRTDSDLNHELRLRILLDRWSAEVFVNGGEQVLSMTHFTDLSADGITFRADGSANLTVTQYRIDCGD